MKIDTLPEDSIVQVVYSEVQRMRKAHRIITRVLLTQKEYADYLAELKVPDTLADSFVKLPIADVYFEVIPDDGGEPVNPAAALSDRRVVPVTGRIVQ